MGRDFWYTIVASIGLKSYTGVHDSTLYPMECLGQSDVNHCFRDYEILIFMMIPRLS